MNALHGPAAPPRRQVNLLGLPVDDVDNRELLDVVGQWVKERGRQSARQICTVNPEFLVDAQNDAAFRRVLEEADLRVADGIGVLLAARALGQPLRERVTGSDGIVRIAERAAQEKWRLYLLGAADGVAERAAARLADHFPGILVSGCHAGSPDAREWPGIVLRLRAARPDVLFVAYGHPRQDFWVWAHRSELPCAVAIGVGGAFDYLAGVTPRAPEWLRGLGLEWLFRLITQPWRWRRMLKLPVFVWLVAQQRLDAEAQRRRGSQSRS